MDITLLATADWDHPFWTNKQHVAESLAALGHRVLYIDSLGLRLPTLASRDRLRLLRRLQRCLRGPRQVRPGLWVLTPPQIPSQGQAWLDRCNRGLLAASLLLARWQLRFRPDVLWTYNPRTSRLLALRCFARSLYHCVDAIDAQPGMNGPQLRRDEQHLCQRVDLVVTTTPLLEQRCRASARRCVLFPNAVDVEHFARARQPDVQIPADLAAIPEPRLLFVGALAAYKQDFGLLAAVARAHPDWSIVLIGAVGEGDPSTSVSVLEGCASIHLLGPRPYAQLPAYLKGAAVGLIPALLNDYTRAMFPMKFFEYLAAGLPVVATPLPALKPYGAFVDVAAEPIAFAEAIQTSLAAGTCHDPALAELLQAVSYRQRSLEMLRLLAPSGDGSVKDSAATCASAS
jgi:glycosyltransferase involved in cell wall biosynthesis